MLYKIILYPVTAILMVLFSRAVSAEWGDTTAQFINTTRAMRAFGFPDGRFTSKAEILQKLDSDIAQKVGAFEGSEDIDSTEEFLTAALYSGLTPDDPDNQEIIRQELSTGSGAARKLGALWLKQSADNKTTHETALTYILNDTGVSRAQVHRFYHEAINAEIDTLYRRIMGDIPHSYYTYNATENAIDCIREYYKNPGEATYAKLMSAVTHFGKKSTESDRDRHRFRLLLSLIEQLSPRLKKMLADDFPS